MENDTSSGLVSETRIRQQAIAYYLVLALWPLYLFFLPPVFVYGRLWVVPYLIFPGLFLFTWLGYLMHESWHKYVPSINNTFFYNTFALMILSDPQLYFIIHSMHHSQVHTFQDSEFHPAGNIKSRVLRIIYNWSEVLIGVAFLVVVGTITVPGDSRFNRQYRYWKLVLSITLWVIFLGSISYASHLIFGVRWSQAILAIALTYWLGSFFLHQSQLIEHGNLIVEGNFRQRNLRTRNLRPAGIFEKIFLFLTHNDSREHVFHHTITKTHSRLIPGVMSLPENAVTITLRDYLKILGRMLKGKMDHEKAE